MGKTTLQHKSTTHSTNPREALLSRIKGRTAYIPNLKPIFSDWRGTSSRHCSKWVELLRKEAEIRIQSLGFSKAKRKKLQAADFGLFTALWWPDARFEELKTLTYLVIWLFTWDDEIDEPTGAFSGDFDGAQTYREHTLQFVGDCLGLVPVESDFRPLNRIVQSFDIIGSTLRASYDVEQCRRFYDAVARFMEASEIEQRFRLKGQIPTLEEYWAFRLGTSAVYIGSAAGEFSMSSQLPSEVMRCKYMEAIWDETNLIISITNDLVSLKKEMRLDCIDSIVPLTFALTNNIQKAISESLAALKSSKERFNEAAKALLSGQAEDEEMYQRVNRFIEVQKSNCVGNLIWSLETQRYSMLEVVNEDGSQTFTL
ncbi:hypothetical protein DL769_000926 [Monosporascus sp. CRB-8-3]|nr:hypothetical protein DL769_000926 [Monosporascus sp. CRB-8-3]